MCHYIFFQEVIIIRTYQTSEVAGIVGIHPNTVRLYEDLELIPKPERKANGYRVFTDLHIDIFKLARTAFQIEVLQNGLRRKIVAMVKSAARRDFDTALILNDEYLQQVQKEKKNAKEAIEIVKELLSSTSVTDTLELKRNEAAGHLQISMDTLRNWEMNGLLTVKRKVNGYRVYTGEDMKRLKMIRSLRCANYSLEAILRMLSTFSRNPDINIEQVLDTPQPENEMIISVYDKLLTSLRTAEKNAELMKNMLYDIKSRY